MTSWEVQPWLHFQQHRLFSSLTYCYWLEWMSYVWFRDVHIWPLILHLSFRRLSDSLPRMTPYWPVVIIFPFHCISWGSETKHIFHFLHRSCCSASWPLPTSIRAIDPIYDGVMSFLSSVPFYFTSQSLYQCTVITRHFVKNWTGNMLARISSLFI